MTTPKGERPADEKKVLRSNAVVEFFIDPDSDGRSYMELQVNASGAIADSLKDYPYSPQARAECGININGEAHPNLKWNCVGLEVATRVKEKHGWNVEMAIPWKAISTEELLYSSQGIASISPFRKKS